MSWYFAYISPLPEGTVSATIVQSRPSRLVLSGPVDDVPELGSFVAKQDDEAVARLQSIVKSSNYVSLPASGPVPPETALLSMGEGQNDDPPDPFRGFVFHQLPPQLQPVRDDMQRHIDMLRQHPHHVVRGTGRWTQPQVAPRGDIVARVQLTNPGSDLAELYHPAGPLVGGRVTTTLTVSRKVPPAQAVEPDVQTVGLDAKSIVALDAQGNPEPAAETITLTAGASIELELRTNVYLSPGPYYGEVTFRFAQGDLDYTRAVYGTLQVPIGPFAVT